MNIKEITTYKIEGQTYECIADVAIHVEDRLGQLIDKMLPNIGPSLKLEVFSALVANRGELSNILSTNFESDSSDPLYEGKMISIFELSRRSKEYEKAAKGT